MKLPRRREPKLKKVGLKDITETKNLILLGLSTFVETLQRICFFIEFKRLTLLSLWKRTILVVMLLFS